MKKSFFGFFINMINLSSDLLDSNKKGELGNYLLHNHNYVVNSLSISRYEGKRDSVKKFLSSNFVRKRYKELSDFVDTYYKNMRRN